jgi:hypothetical protein
MFRDGRYSDLQIPYGNFNMSNHYALNIAIDSRQKSLKELNSLFQKVIENKVEELTKFEKISNFITKIIFFWRCNCPCDSSNN